MDTSHLPHLHHHHPPITLPTARCEAAGQQPNWLTGLQANFAWKGSQRGSHMWQTGRVHVQGRGAGNLALLLNACAETSPRNVSPSPGTPTSDVEVRTEPTFPLDAPSRPQSRGSPLRPSPHFRPTHRRLFHVPVSWPTVVRNFCFSIFCWSYSFSYKFEFKFHRRGFFLGFEFFVCSKFNHTQ